MKAFLHARPRLFATALWCALPLAALLAWSWQLVLALAFCAFAAWALYGLGLLVWQLAGQVRESRARLRVVGGGLAS